MPLIRYRVGDRGSFAPPGDTCSCGRQLPLLGAVEGRCTDMLLTRDGRQVFWLNPVFYGLPVRQSQITQESIDHLRVRVAPGLGFNPTTARTIEQRLRSRTGDTNVTLEIVEEIERTANGKLQAVISRLTAQEREAVMRGSRTANLELAAS
jgi:phenylacetate-CoA ligase